MEARTSAAQQRYTELQGAIAQAQEELQQSKASTSAAVQLRVSAERELQALEAEAAQLSAEIQGARRTLQEELARAKEEAKQLELAIGSREAELVTRRAEIASQLRETEAACGAASDLASQLRAQAAQRTAMREEAARLRARLQDRGVLQLHSELMALRRASAAAASSQAAKLEDVRRRRVESQSELKGLSGELERLRQQVSSGLRAKAQAEGVLLNLTAELVAATAQVERSKALAARRAVE
jgi:chromosome segregation ATPase